MRFFKGLHLISILVVLASQAHAQPKPFVLVPETQDRHITFSDGGRLNHGFEITYLLMKYLFDSGKYQIIAPGITSTKVNGFSVMATGSNPSPKDTLKERLPDINFDFLDQLTPSKNANGFSVMARGSKLAPVQPHIIIRPRVETLLYSSGERSNRMVYGFAPDKLNPYNAGVAGGKDNEFTTTEYARPDPVSGKVCENVDFFGGQLNALGWGPSLSNFGANSDEGIELFLFGYGFGFKKKNFEVKSEIVFQVELPLAGQIKEYRYELKGNGKDVSVGVSYQGISVGFEIARVKTLRMALQTILTNVVENFMKDVPPNAWNTEIGSFHNGQWLIPVGKEQGITENLSLQSTFGSLYTVTKLNSDFAVITPALTNVFEPFVGERLFLAGNVPTGGGIRTMASLPEVRNLGEVEIVNATQPEQIPPPIAGPCAKKKPSTIEKFLMGITWVYGFIRYKTVFDQSFTRQNISTDNDKIALIGSGVDPKDERLFDSIDATGFDFISWDARPSDDLGMGTAAALLLTEKIKNLRIVPLKVLTPFANTHSSAVYQSLVYAAERADIQTVLLTFKPGKDSQAVRDGVQILVAKGKTVIVPEGIQIPGAIEAPPTHDFKTRGLGGAKLKLSSIGTGVIEKFIEITTLRAAPKRSDRN